MASETNKPQPLANKQQREFVRIDDMLPLAWRKVGADEYAEVMAHFERFAEFPPRGTGIETTLASLDINDKLRQLERNDPVMARILGRLDMKLNLLLRLFHPSESERPMVLTPVNLSGGGLAFWENGHDLAKDDILDLRISFSVDVMVSIFCYAKVTHIAPNHRDQTDKIACNFEPILTADREKLIQYIFRRQAELLRSRKTTPNM
ncbi:MAG: PilZ domain-containing protein [Magnetococcales bacterium]|nr:PilZ domain-containing protein [Magnetococcales bacterium]